MRICDCCGKKLYAYNMTKRQILNTDVTVCIGCAVMLDNASEKASTKKRLFMLLFEYLKGFQE